MYDSNKKQSKWYFFLKLLYHQFLLDVYNWPFSLNGWFMHATFQLSVNRFWFHRTDFRSLNKVTCLVYRIFFFSFSACGITSSAVFSIVHLCCAKGKVNPLIICRILQEADFEGGGGFVVVLFRIFCDGGLLLLVFFWLKLQYM